MKKNNIKCLSIFDGISGCQQAFKELGIEFDGKDNIYFASEIDKHAITITQKNFPNTVQLGDVKNINYCTDYHLHFNNEKEITCRNIDLICFGSPCQSLSIAKRDRKGLNSDDSGLFYEALRIIKEVKPRFFIMENVKSMSKESRDIISKELGVDAVMIDSSILTAQSRKRLYWVSKYNESTDKYEQVFIWQPQDQGIMLKDILESGVTWNEKSYALTASYSGAEIKNTLERKQRTMIAEPICVASRGRNIGGGHVPQILISYNSSGLVGKNNFVIESKPQRVGHIKGGGQGYRVYNVNNKSVCLSANGGGAGAKTGLYKIDLPNGDYIVRKLTPIEAERLQGFPDNFTEGIAKTNRYKALGNSFTVPVIVHILKHLFE